MLQRPEYDDGQVRRFFAKLRRIVNEQDSLTGQHVVTSYKTTRNDNYAAHVSAIILTHSASTNFSA